MATTTLRKRPFFNAMARTLGTTIQSGEWRQKRSKRQGKAIIAAFEHNHIKDPLTGTLVFKGLSLKMRRSRSELVAGENRLIAKGRIGPKGRKFKEDLFQSRSGFYELREIEADCPDCDPSYRIIVWGDHDSHAWMEQVLNPSAFGLDPQSTGNGHVYAP